MNWKNIKTYGSAKKINTLPIKIGLILSGIIVPVIIPLPVVTFIAAKLKSQYIMRYE